MAQAGLIIACKLDLQAKPSIKRRRGFNLCFVRDSAGKDAARAFVTGCFETHLTHDLRGLTPTELEVC